MPHAADGKPRRCYLFHASFCYCKIDKDEYVDDTSITEASKTGQVNVTTGDDNKKFQTFLVRIMRFLIATMSKIIVCNEYNHRV